MREDFEEWAKGKVALVHSDGNYRNLEAQTAWQAWQRAWNIAVREQRRKDEEEIKLLKLKITTAINTLGTKIR